ncbi:MAG: patatin-like phospholipase family protein, partial [Haliea sp.]
PSRAFVASLPLGKIPDRSDFKRLSQDARVAYWRECMARSRVLAGDFAALLANRDPLAGAVVLS